MMTKSEQLADLAIILERLGPSRSLDVDHRELSVFMPEESWRIDEATVECVRTFASEHECGFVYDQESRRGRFFRAYFAPAS
jgi:hypothetical protein